MVAGPGGDWVYEPEILHQRNDSRVLRPQGELPGTDWKVSPPENKLEIFFSSVYRILSTIWRVQSVYIGNISLDSHTLCNQLRIIWHKHCRFM